MPDPERCKCADALNFGEPQPDCSVCGGTGRVPQPPRWTGKKTEDLVLTGMFMPCEEKPPDGGARPVLLKVPASDGLYLPLFSSREDLERVMRQAEAKFVAVVVVDDGEKFLREVPRGVTVMVNPRFMPDGKVRWMEVKEN